MNGRGGPTDVRPRIAAVEEEEEEEEDHTARALLTTDGFDPDDLNKVSLQKWLWTPMIYYSANGNVTMIRYLIAHGADGRKIGNRGIFPLYSAAAYGHLEIVKLLSRDGGALEDIRRRTTDAGYSPLSMATPLRAAFYNKHFIVVQWLILNGALTSRFDDINGGGIADMVLRRDLRQSRRRRIWDYDKREKVQAWAQDIVTNHDTVVTVLLTGMIVRSNQTSSSLVVFKGTSGILEVIAQYMAEKPPHQVRMLRQLMILLRAFIDDTPFETEEEYAMPDERQRRRTPPRRRR